jgi:transposase-like protein
MNVPSIEVLEKTRWGERPRCASCWSLHVKPIGGSPWKKYYCETCKHNFSVLTNTPFQQTHLSPDQLQNLIALSITNQLNRKPSELCKVLKVHHWTMTKLIRKVKGLHVHYILSVPAIFVFEGLLEDLDADMDLLPYLLFLYVYVNMTKDPVYLSCLTGLTDQEVQKALDQVKKYWPENVEFREIGENDWVSWENWMTSPNAVLISIHLHAMCIKGLIVRDPQTGMYNLK